MVSSPRRFEVYLVDLEPTRGSEIQKTRPCTVLSPDEMNRHLKTVIVAPMTTSGKDYPSRVPVILDGRHGRVALDQIRSVDRVRLVRQLGELTELEAARVLQILGEMFSP